MTEKNLLERFQAIATVLWKFRYLFVFLGIAGLLGFGLSLFESPFLQHYQLMMPSLVLFFWAAGSLCFSSLFMHLPAPVSAQAKLVERWGYKLRRAFYWVLAVLMIGLSSGVVLLSFQLIRAWTKL